MNSENKVSDVDIYKAIGQLDEATEVMRQNHEVDYKSEDQVVGLISFLGRIVKALIAK